MEELINSYMKLTVVAGQLPIIEIVKCPNGITIPANAQPLPYDKEITLPVGRYNIYHDRDCRWFTNE